MTIENKGIKSPYTVILFVFRFCKCSLKFISLAAVISLVTNYSVSVPHSVYIASHYADNSTALSFIDKVSIMSKVSKRRNIFSKSFLTSLRLKAVMQYKLWDFICFYLLHDFYLSFTWVNLIKSLKYSSLTTDHFSPRTDYL